jgi:hypothetical protein
MSEKIRIRSKSSLSVLRSINNVAVFVHVAGEYGINPKDILAGSGIKMSDLDDPRRITRPDMKKIFHCPVFFGVPEHFITFDASRLDKPLKQANSLRRRFWSRNANNCVSTSRIIFQIFGIS